MKTWISNILLGLGATIVTLVLLEIALRFVYPAHDSWKLYSVPHPELGWVLEPNAEFTRQLPGSFVKVRYNSDGFRDSDGDAPAPEGATRIVVLGDSFMEANMVPLEDVFHKQLERLAQADGRSFRTWNLGVAGYGNLQEYLTFKRAGEKRKPDLVLLAFYLHNDVRNNAEHLNLSAQQQQRGGKRKRPFLDENNQTEWKINKPDYEEINRKFQRKRNSFFHRLRHRSVLITMYRNARRSLRSYREAFAGGSTLAWNRCNSTETFARAWNTTERILKRLKQDVEASGAKLVVFNVPALFDADFSVARDAIKSTGNDKRKLCIEDSPGYRHLKTVLERNGIGYVDIVPAFRQAVSSGKGDLFVKGDWHWNGAGHALAAKEVYRELKDSGYLE